MRERCPDPVAREARMGGKQILYRLASTLVSRSLQFTPALSASKFPSLWVTMKM